MQCGGSDYIKLFNKTQFSDYRGNAHRNAKKKKHRYMNHGKLLGTILIFLILSLIPV